MLEVVYLIFNEGYAATAGDDWMRPELTHEALRLGRVLAELAPDEPEVHGLVALMEIQSSRTAARVGPGGEPVPLLEQNRGRWDQLLIRRGYAALLRAERLGRPVGPYVLQAAIAACHARARAPRTPTGPPSPRCTARWRRLTPTPVVELNRAVAVAMADGPERGLEIVDAIADDPALRDYHLLPTVRGDLLARLGRADEARAEFAPGRGADPQRPGARRARRTRRPGLTSAPLGVRSVGGSGLGRRGRSSPPDGSSRGGCRTPSLGLPGVPIRGSAPLERRPGALAGARRVRAAGGARARGRQGVVRGRHQRRRRTAPTSGGCARAAAATLRPAST